MCCTAADMRFDISDLSEFQVLLAAHQGLQTQADKNHLTGFSQVFNYSGGVTERENQEKPCCWKKKLN